jgi:hypothetical protein
MSERSSLLHMRARAAALSCAVVLMRGFAADTTRSALTLRALLDVELRGQWIQLVQDLVASEADGFALDL